MPSDNTSFMIVLGSILLLSMYYLFGSQPIHNEGPLQIKNKTDSKSSQRSQKILNQDDDSAYSSRMNEQDSDNSEKSDAVSNSDDASSSHVSRYQADMDDSVDSSLEIIKDRAMGMNGPYYRQKNGGKYKHDSYRALGAGKTSPQVDKHFKVPDVTKNYTDRFIPVDVSDEQNAPVNIPNIKGTEKEKYNVNSFLPQEKEKDWFETIETVDVKNSHLINIYRPIGANTIGSSHKAAIYDIRGLDKAVCPKFVVSPWLQSSYEPDRSSKSLCA